MCSRDQVEGLHLLCIKVGHQSDVLDTVKVKSLDMIISLN